MWPCHSDQGSQRVVEDVQCVTFRPTCAEKVRRLKPAPMLNPSNLLTSSNLTVRRRARTRAHIRAHARMCVYIPVRWVRRLDSRMICLLFFRPTYPTRLDG